MSKSIAPVAKADGDESLGSKTPCVSASCSFALQLRLEQGQNMQLPQLIGDFVEFVPLEVLAASEFDIRLSDSARWYCAVVRPQCHNRLAFELARQGFRSFYPRRRKWASHARVKKAVERPVLGQYLFVEVDHPRQSYSTVNAIPDVDHMVSNLGAPIPFPRHWVESAIQRYMTGEFDAVAQGPIPVGAKIRIMEGEFNEQLATVVSVKGRLAPTL